MSYFRVTQICPFSNFIFARERVNLLAFSLYLLTLFRGACCAWYALLYFEGKVPDRVTAISNVGLRFIAGYFRNIISRLSIPL